MQPPKMPPGPFKRPKKKSVVQEAASKIVGQGLNKAKSSVSSKSSLQDVKRKALSPVVKAVTGGRLEEDGSISGKRKKK